MQTCIINTNIIADITPRIVKKKVNLQYFEQPNLDEEGVKRFGVLEKRMKIY